MYIHRHIHTHTHTHRQFDWDHEVPSLNSSESQSIVLLLLLLLRHKVPALGEWLTKPANSSLFLDTWRARTGLGSEELTALQVGAGGGGGRGWPISHIADMADMCITH
jgi:hypothetical protein